MHRPIVKSYKQYNIANQGNRLNKYSSRQSEILLAKASGFFFGSFSFIEQYIVQHSRDLENSLRVGIRGP